MPGDPASSNLLLKMRSATKPSGGIMPIDNPDWVPEEELVTVEAWIAQGVPEHRG